MHSDMSQSTGQKRSLPARVDRDSNCTSVNEVDCSFSAFFLRFPRKIKTIGNNWNTIGTIALRITGQQYSCPK